MNKQDKKRPLISIITPTFNSAGFLKDNIESVLSQTYPNIEHIIIDGGSTDGTVDIIKEYEGKISYWVSEKDFGIADAFNKGLKASRGEYIQFLNSDDWLADKSVIEEVVEALENNNNPLLLYGCVEMVDRSTGANLWRAGKEFSLKGLILRMTIPHQALFTKREFFDRYGCFDPDLRYSMDYEILLRSLPLLQAVWLNRTIVMMREGGASRSNRGKTILEAARAQVRHGVRSSLTAYSLALFLISGMLLRDLLEALGIRISKRF